MSALRSLEPLASPEVAHILNDVFMLCRVPFVHDFIFTSDPVADISILTAPVQKEHAIAARITVSGTETSPSFSRVFDFSSDFFFCSIPAFSVGSITVGFATQEPARDASYATLHAPPPTPAVQCNRYVRDDARGIFFLLSENASSGITEVDCASHRSTRRRTRVCARFDTMALRARLRTARGLLHPDDVASALTYLNVSYERRSCPLCKASGSGECGCTLPFRRPAHPLDFRNERRNMRLHTGLYHGGCTVRLFNAAMPCVISNLATRSIIKGSVDQKVISRLNRYAVQDRLTLLKVNPLSLSMCANEALDAVESYGPQQVAATSDIDGTMACADVPVMLPDASFLQDNGGLQSPSLGSFGPEMFSPGPFPLLAAPLGTGTTLIGALSEVQGSEPGSTHSDNEVRRLRGGASTSATSAASVVQERNFSNALASSSKGFGSNMKENGKVGSGGKERRVECGSEGCVEGLGVKAELRKQRNREAAARSNVKRKIRNEALRRNLAEVNRKATELRGMEKLLREENVRLRTLASQQNFKISTHLSHIQIARSC